jgi:AcrR family transcriptional regulator
MTPENTATTRDRLLTAAIRVFAARGYRDATVREICRQAGSSNINSINYYFGSKESLYREILELIFKAYDDRQDPGFDRKSPEARLRAFIAINCELLYAGGAFEADLTTIFVAEMNKPSPFLEALVDRYNRPRVARHLAMIRDIVGPDHSARTLRACLVSVVGQILYYSFARPVFTRLFPDAPAMPEHARLAEHVFLFSMGGLKAIKKGAPQ